MNGMRKVFCFLMAMTLAAFALPSNAAQPTKIFGLVMAPSTVTTSPVTLTATFSNATPTGNSVIGTVILTPPPGVTVTGTSFPNGGSQVQCPATTVNSSGQTVPVPPGSICVANIPSVMKAACTPVPCAWTMNVSVTLPNNCSVYTWSGQAFAGNSFNGDVFTYQPLSSSVTTTIGTQCPHTITATSSNSGSIAPPGSTTVAYGGSQTYTITPNAHYHVADVTVDGASVGAVTSYTFSNVTANRTISASFAIDQFTVSTSAGANGSISPATRTVDYGSTTTFTVTPDAGYYTTSASGCGGSLAGTTYTTGSVTSACTVSASFARKTLTITSSPTSAAVNTPFDVTVGITPGGATVAMSSDCGATATSSGSATSITFSVTIPGPNPPASGVCTLTFTAPDYQSAPLANLKVFGGVLGCADTNNNYATSRGPGNFDLDPNRDIAYVGDPGWGLRRGPNYDGSVSPACQPVNYSCSLDQVHMVLNCEYDKQTQQKVVLKYVVLWPLVSILNDGTADVWKAFRPQVAWGQGLSTPPSSGQYVPGLSCISDNYNLLEALLPTIPDIAPFTANPLSQYRPNQLARMCIAQLGSTSIEKDPSDPTRILLQPWNKVIDEADGWVGLP